MLQSHVQEADVPEGLNVEVAHKLTEKEEQAAEEETTPAETIGKPTRWDQRRSEDEDALFI